MTHKNRIYVSFDFAIKFLFRQKAYHPILEGFLTCLLDETVKIVEVLESESNKERLDLKITRADIVVKTSAGEIIILEHQHNPQKYFLQRAIFGVSRFLVDHLPAGTQYNKLKHIVSASILDFKLFPGMTDCVYELRAQLVGRHDNSVFDVSVSHTEPSPTDLQLRHQSKSNQNVFPAYYFMIVGQLVDIKADLNYVQQWAYFLEKSRILPSFDAPGIREAAKLLKTAQLSFEELKMWNQHEADLVMQEDIINTRLEKVRNELHTERKNAQAERKNAQAERFRIQQAVKRLADNGQSIEELAVVFNLSHAEVEAILDL